MKKIQIEVVIILLIVFLVICSMIFIKKSKINLMKLNNTTWQSTKKETYNNNRLVSSMDRTDIALYFGTNTLQICYDSERKDCDYTNIVQTKDETNMEYNDNLRLYGTITIQQDTLKIEVKYDNGIMYFYFTQIK